MKKDTPNHAKGDNKSLVLQPCELLGLHELACVNYQKQSVQLQPELIPALTALTNSAEKAGFDMQIASGFRSFERQLLIWNNKAKGVRPVLDLQGRLIDMNALNDDEKVFAILQWSALPGASRHHWGTDLDVYDASRMPANYQLQLTLEETQEGGPFAEFHAWLTQALLVQGQGFYRPYIAGVGAVAPEPWHLSYAPLAQTFLSQFTEALLREKIQTTEIALQAAILNNLAEIFERYIKPYQG